MQNQPGGEVMVVASDLSRLHPQSGGALEWEQNDAELPGCSRLSGSWQTQAPIGTTLCSWSDPHKKLDSMPWECSFLPASNFPALRTG